ncbi:MAG TPA: efflux RND transporter periplasmic adaptor subunit [Steroidobacteraceae bacterium]|nr:efflux RND transporter periplasmic adaptor subunit [Steroidobacteraceae bacterium]
MPFTSGGRRLLPAALIAVALLPGLGGCGDSAGASADAARNAADASQNDAPIQTVELTAAEQRSVSVQAVAEHAFTLERETVGTIDFDEDRAVQVSPPYQGRIVRLFAGTGDKVRRGQLLFTIDSPDLVQAESTLISAAGVLELTTRALARARGLYAIQGMAQKDYQQAISDEQSAEAAYKAARDAVRIFGKSEKDIDRIVARRRVDAQMPVASPIDGVVTARNAAPGALVQPGGTPAPYAVADVSTKWLLADVPEADLPLLRLGQTVDVKVLAYPSRLFHGRITNIAEAVDPDTHRVTVRSQIPDPHDELRAQMFATFTVHVGGPTRELAVPVNAVVREGDGTMTVWVTGDGRRFERRTVRIGAQQAGFDQITGGLRAGERIAATGALFISNAAVQGAAD